MSTPVEFVRDGIKGVEYRDEDGKWHREDGPAIEYANGTKHWYLHGKCHRLDGPAEIYGDSKRTVWDINGRTLSIDETCERLKQLISLELDITRSLIGKVWDIEECRELASAFDKRNFNLCMAAQRSGVTVHLRWIGFPDGFPSCSH